MSKIFPNKLPKEVLDNPRRKAEVKVFNALKNAEIFSTQKVYYSASWLNTVNKRDAQSDGECDFVITDSDMGIIYIEVKGGIITKDKNNIWYSNGKEIKNPIEQAKKSKHIITNEFIERWNKKYPLKRNPALFRGHFVILPNSSCQLKEDLGLFGNIKQFGFKEDLDKIEKLISNFFYYVPQGEDHLSFDKLGIDGQELFHEMLTKPINFTPSLREQIKDNNFDIGQLTDEQEKLLSQSVGNWKRLWVEGPAGSGKTSIALKKFTKEAKEINKVAFICRGKNLQIKLSAAIKDIDDSLHNQIFTFDSFLLQIANDNFKDNEIKFINTSLSNEGYSQKIRDYILNIAFDISNKIEKYDLIIIDESQDFEDSWWLLIDELISKESIVWIFGDSNQNIWKTNRPEIKGISESFNLSSILRNTQQIAKQSIVFYDGQGYGINIKGPYASDVKIQKSESLIESLEIELNKLISIQSIDKQSITILADKSIHNEIMEISNERFKITNKINESKDVFLSSIVNFKGLESDCVLILLDDLSKLSDDDLYIGISRAKSHLSLLIKNNDYEELLNILN